jgi:hypothetical protein
MPPKSTQKQKQKQTVIVNIGDRIVKRKRRKPRKKAEASAPSGSFPPPPPPANDFARVIYQAQAMRPPDNLAVQLNAVTQQLEELQNKQLNRTGNLMAAAAAIARAEGEQGSVLAEAPAPAPATPAKKKGRRTKEEVLEAEAMGFEDKTRRPYVKKQTRAEQAAEILLQQSGVMGGGRQPSLADVERGSAMSSITMTPALQTPAPEPAVRKKLVLYEPTPTPTPDTSSISEASFGGASAATEPRF